MSTDPTSAKAAAREAALRLAESMAGYIGNPKRRFVLADDILELMMAQRADVWRKAADMVAEGIVKGCRCVHCDARDLTAAALRAKAEEEERDDG